MCVCTVCPTEILKQDIFKIGVHTQCTLTQSGNTLIISNCMCRNFSGDIVAYMKVPRVRCVYTAYVSLEG